MNSIWKLRRVRAAAAVTAVAAPGVVMVLLPPLPVWAFWTGFAVTYVALGVWWKKVFSPAGLALAGLVIAWFTLFGVNISDDVDVGIEAPQGYEAKLNLIKDWETTDLPFRRHRFRLVDQAEGRLFISLPASRRQMAPAIVELRYEDGATETHVCCFGPDINTAVKPVDVSGRRELTIVVVGRDRNNQPLFTDRIQVQFLRSTHTSLALPDAWAGI